MGNAASGLGSALLGTAFPFLKPDEPSNAPEEFVIVPPMITLDRQEINRMAFSSYDWAHRKRELSVLLTEYLQPGAVARLNVVPPSNDRLLSTVNLFAPDILRKGWRHFLSETNGAGALQTEADLTVRAHLTPGDPHSFLAFVAGGNQGFLSPGVHFAAVPADGAGPGLFGSLPFLPESPEKAAQLAQLGVRYASPSASCGATTTPMATTIDKVWALLRDTPDSAPNTHVTFGAQLEPNLSVRDALERGAPPDGLLRANQVSTFLEYQSGAPDSYFSVLVEAERASVLRFSVLQHLARVRRIYNLFEDDDVVGITNYLDFGISVAAPVATGANGATAGRTTYEAAAAWQVNSNVLVKAALSSARVCAAFVAKSWWEPCFSLSAMAGWDFDRNEPCAGLSLHVDNDVDLRYERGLHTAQTGSLVRQKHAASKAEGKVAAGARLVVRGGEEERDASDQQLLVPPTVTHRRSELL